MRLTIATGTDMDDCVRRLGMTWAAFDNGAYPRLRNNQSPYIGYYCGMARS